MPSQLLLTTRKQVEELIQKMIDIVHTDYAPLQNPAFCAKWPPCGGIWQWAVGLPEEVINSLRAKAVKAAAAHRVLSESNGKEGS